MRWEWEFKQTFQQTLKQRKQSRCWIKCKEVKEVCDTERRCLALRSKKKPKESEWNLNLNINIEVTLVLYFPMSELHVQQKQGNLREHWTKSFTTSTKTLQTLQDFNSASWFVWSFYGLKRFGLQRSDSETFMPPLFPSLQHTHTAASVLMRPLALQPRPLHP